MKSLILFALFFSSLNCLSAQGTPYKPPNDQRIKSTDILIGIHWQVNDIEKKSYRYYEVGFAKAIYISHHHGINGGAVYASEEVYFGKNKNIFGTKVGAWYHYLFDLGLSMIYYTDFNKGNFKIRPEFGAGMGKFRVVLGYNIPTIDNKAFKELQNNKLQISTQLTVGLNKKVMQQYY